MKKIHSKRYYYHKLFDLPKDVDAKTARRRFREWSLLLHPDKCSKNMTYEKCSEGFRIMRTALPQLLKWIRIYEEDFVDR